MDGSQAFSQRRRIFTICFFSLFFCLSDEIGVGFSFYTILKLLTLELVSDIWKDLL